MRVTENPTKAFPRLKVRGFEPVKLWHQHRKHHGLPTEIVLPKRATTNSCAYDFFAVDDVVIPPSERGDAPFILNTGLKAYMRYNEMLILANRSSGPKKGLVLANSIGLVDADFFGNVQDDGHIRFAYWNVSKEPVTILRGDKIGQGYFTHYLKIDGDSATGERRGGFGSTGI